MESTFLNDTERPTVTLRDGIDLTELRDPEGSGVLFEVNEEDEKLKDEPDSNSYFDSYDRLQNLYHPDDSDGDTGDENDELSPFDKMAKKMEDICPAKDGGVLKKILKQGSGLCVPEGALVRVHFNGFLEYADEPFDSSRLRNQVQKFRLGQGEVIEGWDIAVATMKKGELSRFIIQSIYVLGEYGCPPRIPKDATVMFEIELLSFVEHAGMDDYFNMTAEEKKSVAFSDIKKLYTSITQEAKQLFQAKQTHRAFVKYKKIQQVLEDHRLKDEVEEREQQKLLLRVCLNMALCAINECHSGRAIYYCRQALEIEKKNPKALYLFGKALHQMSEFERALGYYKKAQMLKPSDRDINMAMEKLNKDMKNFRLIERDMYGKMFSKPAGETEEERAVVERRVEEAEEKALKCSDGFKSSVRERLEEFKNNRDLIEFPMPSYNFTVSEIQCMMEMSEELDLDFRLRGSGQNKQIRISKKHPEAQDT